MEEDIHEYESEAVDVSWDAERCTHARACVRGLPAVFDTSKRPWVDPGAADVEAVVAAVTSCPTGALQFERRDGSREQPPSETTVTVEPDGPLYLHGDIELVDSDGATLLTDTRVALCRCGASGNTPLCDGSHADVEFSDDGRLPADETDEARETEADGHPSDGPLTLTPTADGPVTVDGAFRLVGADTRETSRHGSAELCRCGASGNKPFCDYSHLGVDFSTDDG